MYDYQSSIILEFEKGALRLAIAQIDIGHRIGNYPTEARLNSFSNKVIANDSVYQIHKYQLQTKLTCHELCHLPRASPTRILSPGFTQNLNSCDESPSWSCFDIGAWKTSTTVDPMLKAASWG